MRSFLLWLATAYVAINGWILWWFWRSLRGSRGVRWLTCLLLLALMACFPLLYPHGSWGGSAAGIWMLRAGCFWIGSFFYVLFMTLAVDLSDLWRRLRHGWRRNTERPRYAAAFGILVLTAAVGLGGWVNASFPVLAETRLTVAVPLPEGEPLPASLTIAAIADIHLGRVNGVSRLMRAVDLVAPQNPDVVFFLGDVLDDHIAVDEAGLKKAVERLEPPLGTWGILGNHEYISGPVEKSIEMIERSGIRLLRDEWVILADRLLVAGRDDYSRTYFQDGGRKSLKEILKDVPADERRLTLVVLDHQPFHLEEAEEAAAALQLSGHTHNGQLWPFNLVVKRVYENAHGYSRRGNTGYIVSAGTGTWGPPMRNNARPEVLFVRIDFVEQDALEK